MSERVQPACGNLEPHAPHNGSFARPLDPGSPPWCEGVKEGTTRRDGEGEVVVYPRARIRTYGIRRVQEPRMLTEVARALSLKFPGVEIQDDEGRWCHFQDGKLVPLSSENGRR